MKKTEMLEEWFSAVEELKKNYPKAYEEIEDYADWKWTSIVEDELKVAEDPFGTVKNYLDFLSSKGIIKRKDFRAEKIGEKIMIHVSGDYLPVTLRGKLFSNLIERVTEKTFDSEVKKSDHEYTIELKPGVFTLKVVLFSRVKRGSVKVSDKDLKKLGMEIIEEIKLVPVGKDVGIEEMMFAESGVRPGFVVMNIGDAKSLGLGEGDKVILEKRGTEEETSKEEKVEEEIKKEKPEPAVPIEKEKESPKEEVKEEEVREEVKKEKPEPAVPTTPEEKKSLKPKKSHKVGYKHEEREKKELEDKINRIRHK